MKYVEYVQKFSAANLEDMKLQMKRQAEALEAVNDKKIKTEEFLEMRRKQDEQTYLEPVLKQVETEKKLMADEIQGYKEALIEVFHAFSVGVGSFSVDELLKEYRFCKKTIVDNLEDVDKEAQGLFEYFLKKEDVEGAAAFLKCRSGSEFEDKYEQKRAKYLEHMSQNPIPASSLYYDSILGYGPYKEDILALFKVCGKIDGRAKPQDVKGVYCSEKTKELMARGAIGEFGNLCRHIYYDKPDGFCVADSDRDMLLWAHEQGFKTAQSETKKDKEVSL